MKQPRAVVVVFARLPQPGRVKTRLAAGVGADHAATFYKLCAEHAFEQVSRCREADGIVFCAAAEDVDGVVAWLEAAGTPLPVQAQVQLPDLGHRMLAALTAAAVGAAGATAQQAAAYTGSNTEQQQQQEQQEQQQRPWLYDAAIVIGTDIPDVSAATLAKAVDALLPGNSSSSSTCCTQSSHQMQGPAGAATDAGAHPSNPAAADMVLGPAADGGYYLLGFRTTALLRPEVQSGQVFAGVEWSSDSVLQRTLTAAARLGLTCAALDTLPVLRDIDTLQDATAWLGESEATAQRQHKGVPQHTSITQKYLSLREFVRTIT